MPLHKKAFYLLLLFLPTQLSIHFWPSWSYAVGRRIDHLSPTIYLTDILIFLIPLSVIANVAKQSQSRKIISVGIATLISFARTEGLSKKIFSTLIIILLIFLNIYNSKIPPLTTYKWLKIFEFFLLGVYIIKNIDTKKDWDNIIKILSLGIIFESLLAIAQFINQSSLDGIFYWLGERSFSISTPNIAKVAINGVLILRPYATFPHPNALAGYLAVLLPLILITEPQEFKLNNFLLKLKWPAFVLGLSALFLTFSRPAIFIGIFAILIAWTHEHKFFLIKFFSQKNFKIIINKKIIFSSLIIILLILFSLIFYLSKISLEKESIDRRISLNIAAIDMFKKNSLVGVGLGNFIPELPFFSKDKEIVRFLQPAHNIYLLTLSETGLFGFAVFLLIIFKSIKKLLTRKNLIKIIILNSLFTILILGLLDHYFLTLHQPQLLFAMILSLSLLKYPHEV